MATQKRSRKKTVIIAGIVATVFTLGLAGTVIAKQRGYGHHGFSERAIEELGLGEENTAKLRALQEQAMQMRTEAHESRGEIREAFQSERNADKPDLRKVIAQAQAQMDQLKDKRQALIDEGLALFDTLEPTQQRAVMDLIANRFGHGLGRMHHGRHGAHEGHGHHERRMRHDKRGDDRDEVVEESGERS